MSIQQRVEALIARMAAAPVYPTQGRVLFVDLESRTTRSAWLPEDAVRRFVGGRGANMYLLYNLMDEAADPLSGDNPLIFGSGVLTGYIGTATRGNVSGLSPDSDALLDANAGDYFPTYMRHHGIDHLVLYGEAADWSLLVIRDGEVHFDDAAPYLGLDNADLTAAVERDYQCTERDDMAMARITRAGENRVLCSGIMAGPKAIYARGGAGAKLGALKVKAIAILGKPPKHRPSAAFKTVNKAVNRNIAATSVIKNALKTVGTPFLYKPSRVLGAMGTRNNQETTWVDTLDADRFDPFRTGMDGCHKCFVRCRPLNDMTPEAAGGFGAGALEGLSGNAGYDTGEVLAEASNGEQRGARTPDRFDRGDGPEYVTVGKFGPNLGLREPWQVLRLNNILNDLGLDASSTGGAIGWAMELYQRGIIGDADTGGLDLSWGNYETVEKLLFMTADREGFGDVIADSARAVARGHYPSEALDYRMAVKGLFQSDPHDSRILKAFALGLAVATRGMDHLRNRVTLEINARINDDPEFKAALYGGTVAAEPNAYHGKEVAVRRCEDVYAVGDAVGMCRFDTQLFNSPSLPGPEDFSRLLKELTGLEFDVDELLAAGRDIMGVERLINARLGLDAAADTLPRRWFEEPTTAGPFKGETVDRKRFAEMRDRFYAVSGLDARGRPRTAWRAELARALTGCAITVKLPESIDGAGDTVVLDRPVKSLKELREALRHAAPAATELLEDMSLGIAVNGELVMSGGDAHPVKDGDSVAVVPVIAGG